MFNKWNRFLSMFDIMATSRRLITMDYARVDLRRAFSFVHCKNVACNRILDSDARINRCMSQSTWVTSKDESHEMMTLWPDVLRDITDAIRNLNIPDVTEWLTKVLQYNVPGGKKTRGLTLVYFYKFLASSDQLTEDNIRLIRILAWCVELMQAYILVSDDIRDQSLVRWNQPCWYRCNSIDIAINDGIMLESVTYYLIWKHFKRREYYVDLQETFQDVVMKVLMGRSLDSFSSNFGKKPDLDLFTMDRYNSIAKYKTAYYTHILPVFVAMHCAGMKDPEMFRQTKTILLEMGQLFQVQDDYLGVYGDPKLIGKDNTDIEKGKCTWLIVTALQHATPIQREILDESYGVSDPEKVRRVKEIYNDLDVQHAYSVYEKKMYNLLNSHIQQISCGIPQDLFLYSLEELHQKAS